MSNTWEPVQVDLQEINIANYAAEDDWLEFDCICMDKNAPNYENIPYDFTLLSLDTRHFTCARCGRQYRLNVKVEVEMYTPITIKYPDAKYSMTPETLGLRDKE